MRSRPRIAVVVALAVALLGAAGSARADGDPASDFLLSQSTFLSPFDGHVPKASAAEIVQLLAEAKAKGFALKVAVIVTRYDLGAVPILFRKPKQYARFLGLEDYYYWKDELLVVMPNGYGIYKASALPAADSAAIAKLPPPSAADGAALAQAAISGIEALAARHGVVLTSTVTARSRGGGSSTWIAVVGGAVGLGAAAGALVLLRRRGRR